MTTLITSLTRPKHLIGSAFYISTISGTLSAPIMIAEFPLRILAATFWCHGGSLAASDSNYFTIDLSRNRANSRVTIATKTTKVTGGEAISQRTAWLWDAIPFDLSNSILAKGDAVEMVFTLTGSASLTGPSALSVRYEKI